MREHDEQIHRCFSVGERGLEEAEDELTDLIKVGIPKLLVDAWTVSNEVLEGLECKFSPEDPRLIFCGFYDNFMELKTFKLQKALTGVLDESFREKALASTDRVEKGRILSQSHLGSYSKLL